MRFLSFSSILCLVGLWSGCNLEEIPEIRTTTFETLVPLAGMEDPEAVIELKDGGYLVCGQTTSFSQDKLPDAFLAKMDKAGKLLWIKNYGGNLAQGAASVIEDNAGNFVICGYANTPVAGDVDVFMAKIDPNGNTVWDTAYAETNRQFGVDLVQLSDRQYMVLYSNYEKSKIEVTTVNPNNGARTLTRSLGNFYPSDMVYRNDNDIVICGSAYITRNGSEESAGYIVKINSSGVPLWENNFPNGLSEGNFMQNYGVSLAQDGGYFLCGSVLPPNTDHDFLLIGVSPLGKEDWRKIPLSTLNADELTSICTGKDGALVAAGYSSQNIYLTKYDPDGTKAWENQLSPASVNAFLSINIQIAAAADGGYLLCTSLNNDIYLVKVNALGVGP